MLGFERGAPDGAQEEGHGQSRRRVAPNIAVFDQTNKRLAAAIPDRLARPRGFLSVTRPP